MNHAPAWLGVSSVGGLNSATSASAQIGAPSAIHGRRRPIRLSVRSEAQPIAGSVIASSARAIAIAIAIQPTGTSTTSE